MTTPKSVPKPAVQGPSRGKDCWKTPVDVLVLINRIYGGQDPPSYVKGLWDHTEAKELYAKILKELRETGAIDLDPCADKDDSYHFADENQAYIGLDYPWSGNVFCNPPYSDVRTWIAQAAHQMEKREGQCLFLIPPSICNLYWIEDLLRPDEKRYPDGRGVNLFATSRSRLAFLGDDGPVSGNTLGSAIVGWVDDPKAAHGLLRAADWVVHRPLIDCA